MTYFAKHLKENQHKPEKKKATNKERKMFLEIWSERPHVSEISDKPLLPLSHPKWHWQFAHVLPKGTNPKFKHYKQNIMLMLPEEHTNQQKYIKFEERKIELMREYRGLKD